MDAERGSFRYEFMAEKIYVCAISDVLPAVVGLLRPTGSRHGKTCRSSTAGRLAMSPEIPACSDYPYGWARGTGWHQGLRRYGTPLSGCLSYKFLSTVIENFIVNEHPRKIQRCDALF